MEEVSCPFSNRPEAAMEKGFVFCPKPECKPLSTSEWWGAVRSEMQGCAAVGVWDGRGARGAGCGQHV